MPDEPRRPRRGRPPRREGPDTRTRLLDAALELFATQGFAATTVRQIAEAVGVRDPAIYAHFAGKQALYDALLAEMGPVSLQALDVDVEELAAATPHDAVPGLVDRLLTAWAQPRALLFTSVLLREGAGEQGPRGMVELIEEALTRLAPPLARWQESGLVRGDLAVPQLVWELFAPLHIARFLHLRAGAGAADVEAARRVAAAHVAFYLTCVTTRERSPS
ncbi:TetR/AcrR family transcriptional regulator [Pseudonocardia sichuanensis]